MLLTLHTDSVASLLKPTRKGAKPRLALPDLPAFARQTLDLHGLNITTDLLAGATRTTLAQLRERADKERCACLLLIEPNPMKLASEDDAIGNIGVDRARKVLQAAHILGCNAAAISIDSTDTEDFLDFSVDRIRQIVDTAEKLDMNLLISPRKGLTANPERVTEMIKKIGGFRVGTLPDFQTAVESGDANAYLRKLVPYASVISATTVELTEPEEPAEAMPVAKAEDEPAAPEEAGAEPPKEIANDSANDSEDAELDGAVGDDALRELIDAVMSEEVEEEPQPPTHKPYELQPLVSTIASVGFDGTVAVRYIGKGDKTKGTDLSRWALEHAIGVATAKK